MPTLSLWGQYTREDVHDVFSPQTAFTPQAGTWGLQGMVRVPDRPGDWVFFVTFGKQQGDHVFDESVTDDGVLSWQSQPSQRLDDAVIRELIQHDDRVNTIHLFLRTVAGARYCYLGTLGYLTHDASRERPVHFQWQLLDWPPPKELPGRIGLQLLPTRAPNPESPVADLVPVLQVVPAPTPSAARSGITTQEFRSRKVPDYAARDARNRELGRKGERLVLDQEKVRLLAAGRDDLAGQVVHVAEVEGDAAGYDIRSYEIDGRPRYIEVKTTEGGATTAFFLTPNELAFSSARADNYVLYRLYEFETAANRAKAFLLHGNLKEALRLTPTAFRAELAAAGDGTP